jgi:hypothetical protein
LISILPPLSEGFDGIVIRSEELTGLGIERPKIQPPQDCCDRSHSNVSAANV